MSECSRKGMGMYNILAQMLQQDSTSLKLKMHDGVQVCVVCENVCDVSDMSCVRVRVTAYVNSMWGRSSE